MTTIDWTQPVETTEDPPRPVRVLATDRPGDFHVVVMHTDGAISTHTLHGTPIYEGGCRLRNVAPPKSEPVMIDFWINLYPTFSGLPFGTEEQANSNATANRVECRRVAWMSDGSPVPGGGHTNCWANYDLMVADRDDWKHQCEQWGEKASNWAIEKDALRASLEEARQQRDDASVAVVTWRTKALGQNSSHGCGQSPKKTAAEAVANVAEMMGPVKSCETCEQFDYGDQDCNFCRRCKAKDRKFWEAKSHD